MNACYVFSNLKKYVYIFINFFLSFKILKLFKWKHIKAKGHQALSRRLFQYPITSNLATPIHHEILHLNVLSDIETGLMVRPNIWMTFYWYRSFHNKNETATAYIFVTKYNWEDGLYIESWPCLVNAPCQVGIDGQIILAGKLIILPQSSTYGTGKQSWH